MSKFIASRTMDAFMSSPSYVRVLAGPIGGGKSVCCAHELMRWACMQAPNANNTRKTRFLIVRNTADQLKSTTKKTIDDWFPPGVYGEYKVSDKTYHFRLRLPDGTLVETEWMLIALDTPDDVRKALSLEATGLWGNECRELHQEVVDGLLMRVNRYPSMKDGGPTRAGAIFDTNMPGEDTWWHGRMETPPKNWSIHIQPPAVLPLDEWIEKYNTDPPDGTCGTDTDGQAYAVDPEHDNYDYLPKDYYPNTMEGKTEDFIRVYLRSRYGRSLSGLPVYDKTFRAERHVSQTPLVPMRSENYPLCIGLDFGRQPAAVIMQTTPRGTINVLSEVIGENMGISTFIRTLLKPHMAELYPGIPCYIAPDPAGWAKSQVGETSPVDVLKSEGFKVVKPPTNSQSIRIEAVEAALAQASDTKARVQIDKARCPMLVGGFRGGYKWRVNKAGEPTNDREPLKNQYSHVHDACQYAILVIDGGHLGAVRRTKARPVVPVSAAGWT